MAIVRLRRHLDFLERIGEVGYEVCNDVYSMAYFFGLECGGLGHRPCSKSSAV